MRVAQKPWLPGAATALLVILCIALGYHQYVWLDELASAEADQLHKELNDRIEVFSQSFTEKVHTSLMHIAETRQADPLFRRVALLGEDGTLSARNSETGAWQSTEWPQEWGPEPKSIHQHGDSGPPESRPQALVEMPLPGPPGHQRLLLAALDEQYVGSTFLPPLVNQSFRPRRYDVAVLEGDKAVYESSPGAAARTKKHADGSAPLFLFSFGGGRGPGAPPPGMPAGGPPPPGRAMQLSHTAWRVELRRRDGSINDAVRQIRLHNTLLSTGMLVLIAGIIALLGHLSSRSAQFAAMQMNFVAGVSHELRTPLTVIRTAAFNLRGKLAQKPEQVEKYGALIQSESDKLTELVEQVLLFARTDAAPTARERKAIPIGTLLESSLKDSLAAQATVEMCVEPGLPETLVDEQAVGQALRNLFDNAVKYGDGMKWLGLRAKVAGDSLEIEIADHGRGIASEEVPLVFNAFFRGKRAIDDQIHGTGLGLNLAKRIIEANGGRIRVSSSPAGTTFTVSLPV